MHFKARNYPKSLTQDEQEDWFEVVQSRMQAGENGYLSIDEYSKRVIKPSYSDWSTSGVGARSWSLRYKSCATLAI
jgi:exonuclease I